MASFTKINKEKTVATTQQLDSNYYEEAKTWYHERYESIVCTKNQYVLATCGLSILLALTIAALCIMMPLKTTIYRIIEVNKQTGELTVLKELEGKRYSNNWAVTHYFLSQYVMQRESYSYEDITRKFNQVVAMSDQAIAQTYIDATVSSSNPKSPINEYKNHYFREVDVLGVDRLNDTTALVRFKTITHNKSDGNDNQTHDWHAVVKWQYVNQSASLQDRDKNPLGIKIWYYQREAVFSDH